MQTLLKLNQHVNNWLTAPEANAAGRMGLYRILYALFYLSYLPLMHAPQLGTLPDAEWRPVLAMLWSPGVPAVTWLQMMQVGLVAGLVLLVIGYRVRLATVLVLLTGLFIVSTRFSFGKVDHANTFMMVYIPAVMLFYNWGSTYSLDAALRQKRGQPTVDPTESTWQHAWPLRAILWLVAIQFMMSGYLKLVNAWLVDFETIPKLMYGYNLQASPNPLNPIIAVAPVLYLPLHFMALAFETLFPLAVINRAWRTFFVSSAVLFHVFTMLFMNINFVAMLITYAIFIDWQRLYQRLRQPGQRLYTVLLKAQTPALIGAAIIITVAGVWLWHTPLARSIQADSEWDMWHYWLIAIPAALYGVMTSGLALLRGLLRRSQPAPVEQTTSV